MKSSRRLLLRDFVVGIGGLALFGLTIPGPVSPVDLALVAGSGLAFAGVQYCSERRAFPERVYDFQHYLQDHLLVTGAVTVLAVLAVLLPMFAYPSLQDRYFDGFVGMYLGLLGYRTLYGVVRPIPEHALNRG